MNRYFFFLVILNTSFLITDSLSQSQQVSITKIVDGSGFRLGKINAIARDSYGFLWLSDQSNRQIIRYDGSYFEPFVNIPGNTNSLGGYYPECLATDTAGVVWIGFYGQGIDRFDTRTRKFTHYRHNDNDPESLNNDIVSTVLVDHAGNLWVGTDSGLDLFDRATGKFRHFIHDPNDSASLSNNVVRTVYEDKSGVIWVGTGLPWDGTNDGGLNRLNREQGTFTRYSARSNDPESISNNKVRAILEDSRGNFWIGTGGDVGLQTLDRETGVFKKYPYDAAHPEVVSRTPLNSSTDHITAITEDTNRNLWIGTFENGLIHYDTRTKEKTFYTRDSGKGFFGRDSGKGFFDYAVWWIFGDGSDLVWICPQGYGIYRAEINQNVIPSTTVAGGIRSFAEESPSVVWLATPNGIERRDFERNFSTPFKDPDNRISIPDNRISNFNKGINSILMDKRGTLWVGMKDGIGSFDQRTNSFKRYFFNPKGTSTNALTVATMYEDSNLNLWIGTFGTGLIKFDRETEHFDPVGDSPRWKGYVSKVVGAVCEYPAKTIWFGGENNEGITRLNTGDYSAKRYLEGLSINEILLDSDSVLWLGSHNGLYRYDKENDEFVAWKINDFICAIVEDMSHNLWITTYSDLIKLNRSRDQITRFDKDGGVDLRTIFITKAGLRRKNGELLFGHERGYISVMPSRLVTRVDTSQLYLDHFWLNGVADYDINEMVWQDPIVATKKLHLKYDQNVFSLSMRDVDFRNSEDARIQYRIEGIDPEWREAKSGERINYFKVPPGEYTFRMKTINGSSGLVTEKSIELMISPPWWTSWWAYCSYVVVLGSIVYFVDRFQRKRLRDKATADAKDRELVQAREIEKAYERLKQTQSQLIQSEKMASLGELTAGIAHEIQNPLNFVNNFSEVNAELIAEMKQELDEGDIKEAKAIADSIDDNERKIIHHGKRADAIVKSMLQHTRLGSGAKEATDINVLADEYLRLAYHGLRAKDKSFNATTETDFEGNLSTINVIPQEIGRVILNLITNAFYAVSDKKRNSGQDFEPTVLIRTRKHGDALQLTVKDNGNGIPRNIVDKIFQPFFTTKPTGQGTGLGLSLSYDIVKAHGGELRVETEQGEGSEFIIILPMG